MRIMFDAVDPAQIPLDAEVVAGYVDGRRSAWPDEAWARWPNATLIRITADPNSGKRANLIDVEQGDYDPADVPGALTRQRALGEVPGVYCNVADRARVETACRDAAVVPPSWYVIAGPDGVATIPSGDAGKQFLWGPVGGGPSIDVSVVADYLPPETLSGMLTEADCAALVELVQALAYNAQHPLTPITPPSGYSVTQLSQSRGRVRRRLLIECPV
jgi:hypothetical protein